MTLTKADLVQQVYKNHDNLTKSQAADAVEAFLRLSKDTLISGSDLLLSGFGKFNVRDKNPTPWTQSTDRRRSRYWMPEELSLFIHPEFCEDKVNDGLIS